MISGGRWLSRLSVLGAVWMGTTVASAQIVFDIGVHDAGGSPAPSARVLTVGPDGVYFIERSQNEIVRIDAAGTPNVVVPNLPSSSFEDLQIDANDILWVLDSGRDRVFWYDPLLGTQLEEFDLARAIGAQDRFAVGDDLFVVTNGQTNEAEVYDFTPSSAPLESFTVTLSGPDEDKVYLVAGNVVIGSTNDKKPYEIPGGAAGSPVPITMIVKGNVILNDDFHYRDELSGQSDAFAWVPLAGPEDQPADFSPDPDASPLFEVPLASATDRQTLYVYTDIDFYQDAVANSIFVYGNLREGGPPADPDTRLRRSLYLADEDSALKLTVEEIDSAVRAFVEGISSAAPVQLEAPVPLTNFNADYFGLKLEVDTNGDVMAAVDEDGDGGWDLIFGPIPLAPWATSVANPAVGASARAPVVSIPALGGRLALGMAVAAVLSIASLELARRRRS